MQLSGKRFGHIRISEPLGEGGMGTVYAGYDETLRRRVALKVLQDHQLVDPDARARLVREARSLSQLDHPNICRIHEYIEGDDVDLLVLEYIEGKTLWSTIEEGALTRAERLRIATAIAEVLVVAHRKGIVHRDLKPDNVMLTPAGQVKVLDFGLARWLEDRTRTPRPTRLHIARPDVPEGRTVEHNDLLDLPNLDRSGSINLRTAVGITVGTPIYMSPEQARGEMLTPASDMFSFGLVLQALFTGREPYAEGLTARQVLLKAARADTLPADGIDRDVAALVSALKSLAPTDRPTAAEAVQRLRHLANRPTRIARRAAAAIVAAMFLSGIVKYTFDLRRERAAAIAAESRAVAAQREAATRRGQAEDLIGFMLGDLRKKLEPLGKLDLLDDVGERALAYSGTLDPEVMTAAELARNAKALTQLGDVRIAQGRLPEATSILARARKLATVAARKEPRNQEAQLALMTAYFAEGEAAQATGDAAAALRHNELYLATAKQLVALSPDNETYQMEQAYAHANVGTYLMSAARYAEATPHFEEALRIKRARLARDPLNVEWQADLANTINKVGVNLLRTGDLAGARRQFEEQRRINAMLVRLAPENAQWQERLAYSHAYLGRVLINLGALAEARSEFVAELALEQALASTDSQNIGWLRNLAITTGRLAMLSNWEGHAAESERRFHSAVALLEEVVRREPERTSNKGELAVTHARSAMARLQAGDVRGAGTEWQHARPFLRMLAVDDDSSRRTLEILAVGAAVADVAGDRDAVHRLRTDAEALFETQALAVSSGDPDVLALRARLLISTGRREQARPSIARLRAIGYREPSFEWTVRRSADGPANYQP
jgi:eukaryotic-like serine/threonine-protein kinase